MKAALVSAEIARIEGRVLDAEQLYEAAIGSARANGFRTLRGRRPRTGGAVLFGARSRMRRRWSICETPAIAIYRWGADAKVKQLEARHSLGWPWRPSRPDGRMTAPSPDQQLDVASVVKASQALSSEMHLPRVDRAAHDDRARRTPAPIAGCCSCRSGTTSRIEAEALALGPRASSCAPTQLG